MLKRIKQKIFNLRYKWLKYRKIRIEVYEKLEGQPLQQVGVCVFKCDGYPQAWELFQTEEHDLFIMGDHIKWYEIF